MSETDVFDRLEIALTEDERRDEWGNLSSTIGFTFTRRKDRTGAVSIAENWAHDDEVYGSGVRVSLPPRVLAEFLKWVAV